MKSGKFFIVATILSTIVMSNLMAMDPYNNQLPSQSNQNNVNYSYSFCTFGYQHIPNHQWNVPSIHIDDPAHLRQLANFSDNRSNPLPSFYFYQMPQADGAAVPETPVVPVMPVVPVAFVAPALYPFFGPNYQQPSYGEQQYYVQGYSSNYSQSKKQQNPSNKPSMNKNQPRPQVTMDNRVSGFIQPIMPTDKQYRCAENATTKKNKNEEKQVLAKNQGYDKKSSPIKPRTPVDVQGIEKDTNNKRKIDEIEQPSAKKQKLNENLPSQPTKQTSLELEQPESSLLTSLATCALEQPVTPSMPQQNEPIQPQSPLENSLLLSSSPSGSNSIERKHIIISQAQQQQQAPRPNPNEIVFYSLSGKGAFNKPEKK